MKPGKINWKGRLSVKMMSVFSVALMLLVAFHVMAAGVQAETPTAYDDASTGGDLTDAIEAPASSPSESEIPATDVPSGTVEGVSDGQFVSLSSLNQSVPRTYLTRSDGILEYWTAQGMFIFNESCPERFEFHSQAGTTLVSDSYFTISVGGQMLSPFEAAIEDASDGFLKISYFLSDKDSPPYLAEMELSFDFQCGRAPKITAIVKDVADGLKDWNVAWRVELEGKASVDMGLYDGMIPLDHLEDQVLALPGFKVPLKIGDEEVTIDWSDAKCGEARVDCAIDADGVLRSSVIVFFEEEKRVIDPTLVATSTNANPTGMACQRKVFFYDSYYWLFYLSSSGLICYQNSADGVAWNTAVTLPEGTAPASGTGFDVATRFGIVAVGWIENGYVYLKSGSILGGGRVSWAGRVTIVGSAVTQQVSVAIGYDKTYWITYVELGVPLNVHVMRSFTGLAGSFTNTLTAPTYDGGAGIRLYSSLMPYTNGNMAFLETTHSTLGTYDSYVRIRWYDSSSGTWMPAGGNIYQIGMISDPSPDFKTMAFSSVASWNGTVHILYKGAGIFGNIFYACIYPSGALHTSGEIGGLSGLGQPSLCMDSKNVLHAFYYASNGWNAICHSQKSEGSDAWAPGVDIWVPPTGSVQFLGVTSWVDPSDFLTVAWAEQGTPKQVKLATIPLPFGTAGTHAEPWNRDGNSPYGTYFNANGHSVSPGSGLLSVSSQLISIAGRGGLNLELALLYQQSRYYDSTDGLPYGNDVFPNTALGLGWSLDLPWIDDTYAHLSTGERFVIQWGNQGNPTEFVNHDAEHFVLREVSKQGTSFYELTMSSGLRYRFNHASPYKLEQISYLQGYNPLSATVGTPLDCINVTYDINGRLQSLTEAGTLRTISFTYYTSGNWVGMVQYITRPDGQHFTLGYSRPGSFGAWYLASVADPLTRTTQFTYDPSKCNLLGGIAFPTGGKATLTYGENGSSTTEYRSFYVTSDTLRNGTQGNSPLIRQTNFNYKVVCGSVRYCDIADYNETGVLQGRSDYVFSSTGGCRSQITRGSDGKQMRATVTWYGTAGQPSQVDTYLGDSATVNSTECMAYDDWGNQVWARDPAGNESFASFANASCANGFQGSSVLKRTASGRIFYDNFDEWDMSDWTTVTGAGSVTLDMATDPTNGPAVKADRTSTSGELVVKHSMNAQSAPFYIQTCYRTNTNYESYILGYSGGSSSRINFRSYNGQFQTMVGASWVDIGACSLNTWYDVGFYVMYSTNTVNVYINGVLAKSGATLGGSGNIDEIRFQIGVNGCPATTVWFDNVRIYSSLTVTVNNLNSAYSVQLYDSKSTLLATSKTGSLTMTALQLNAPPCRIVSSMIGGGMIANPTADVWGGDIYSFTAPTVVSGMPKTGVGYKQYSNLLADDSFPGTYYYGGGDSSTAPWVSDSNLAVSGTSYHTSAYTGGVHYHGFQGGSVSVSTSADLVQYIMLQAGEIPQEIELVYRANGAWSAFFWGGDANQNDLIRTNLGITVATTQWMGSVPQPTNKWIELVVPEWYLQYASYPITGVYYALYGGTAKWDFSAANSEGVVLNGLTSGQTVKMIIDGGPTISATASSSSLTLLPDQNGVAAFPVTATFQILSGTTLLYTSPKISEIYNGDIFTYSSSSFYPNIIKDSIHNRAVGTLTYQDSTKTVSQATYVKYDFEGNAIETKSKLGTSWIYTDSTYDKYGNLLREVDASGRMTSYEYSSVDMYTYPLSKTMGDRLERFDRDTSWTLTETPSDRTWLTKQYTTTRSYSPSSSIQLSFTGASGSDYGSVVASKEFKANAVGKMSVRMYVETYSHQGSPTGNSLDSGIRMRIYDSNNVNYANYTYWLACWSGGNDNRTTADPNIKVVYGRPTTGAWINPVLFPSTDWSIDWSRCDKVKFELFVSTSYAVGDSFKVYYDDFTFGDVYEAAVGSGQVSEDFEGTHGYIPYESPSRAWLTEENSTTLSHSTSHSEKFSFTAGSSGQDYGMGMMSKTYDVSSIDTISIWMYCDVYSHGGGSWDSMYSGFRLRLYNNAGMNYANYTYWLACWYQSTNNKTVPDSYTKVIYGLPTLDTWIKVNRNLNTDWSIDWNPCDQVKIELFVSCSGTVGDSFCMYYDDLSFSGGGSSNIYSATTSYQYDLNNGRLLSTTDPSGHTTSQWFDAIGRVKQTNNSDATYSSVAYDDGNNKATSYDELSQKTVSYFDKIGRNIKVERWGVGASAYSAVTSTYNWLDKPATVTNELNRVVKYTYDALGRVTRVTNPDNTYTATTYDDKNKRTTSADELGHKTVYVMDDLGRLNQTREYYTSSLYYTTQMAYDATGNLLTVKNDNNVTSMSYDSLGRKTSIGYPDSKTESYTYDEAGRVLTATARSGVVTTNAYDNAGNNIRIIGSSDTIRTKYNAEGQVSERINALGNISYYYNNRELVWRMVEKVNATQYSFTYTYNAVGNPTYVDYPDGQRITYLYDRYNRVVDVKIGATLLLNQTYNKDDSVALKKYCNSNSSLAYWYNARGFVSKVLGRDSGNNIILNLNYNYTLDGNVAYINDTFGTAGVEQYWYDQLGRLTKAVSPLFGTIMYGYYPNGDRKWKNEGTNLTYAYGTYSKLSSNGTFSYVYNANGDLFWKNTTVGGVQLKYSFNSFGQLTRVDKYVSGAFNSNLGQYYYDANGARAKVTEGGSSTTYIYAGHDPLYQVGADGKGYKYIYIGGKLELRVYTAAEKYAYLSDALGSTRKVLSNGQIGTVTFSAATYKPFGIAVTTVGSDKLTYASEMKDQTGLFYLFARYYEPELGRFISLDSELGEASVPQTLNRYVYCGNNPLIYTDPTGRFWNIVFGALVGAIIGGVVAALNNEDFFTGAAIGALSGAISGATFGIAAAAGNFLAKSAATQVGKMLLAGGAKVAGQFVGGFASSVTSDLANNREINWGGAVISGGANVLLWGASRGPVAKVAEKVGGSLVAKGGTSKSVYDAFTKPLVGNKLLPWKSESGLGGRLFSTLDDGGYNMANEGFSMVPNAYNFFYQLGVGSVKTVGTRIVSTVGG